jgi:ribosomal protein S18 acetylase RimI-like enzyme
MKAVTLRRANAGEIDQWLEIERSVAHLPTYSAMTDPVEGKEWFAKTVYFFIECDGRIAGSIGYEVKSPDHIYIDGLVIKPEFQGQGIAKQAMIKFLEIVSPKKRIDLVTHPHNSSAIRLYLSFGFIIESWKDDYFGDGEPRITMALNKNG